MLRHPDNTNLHLHREDTFEGLPVMVEKGPFVRQYLSRLKRTIDLALSQYSRVLAFRVDLRLPLGVDLPEYAYTNEVISRFVASFSAKIEHNRDKARERSLYAHDCKCSGLMKPDTHLGENARHIEVSDDQATSCLFR